MVNRVYIELPMKKNRNGRNVYAPSKHAIYHFNNNGKQTSISANYLYGRYGSRGLPSNRSYLKYFNIHDQERALKRARFVVSRVLNNRLRRNNINKGHAGQIKFFASLYKNLYKNNKGNVNIRPLSTFNTAVPFTGNKMKALNTAINNLARTEGVSPNAIRSSNAARHAYFLSYFANSENQRGIHGALIRIRHLLGKMPNVKINTTNKSIKKNAELARLMNNYYHGYSGVQAPKRNEKNYEKLVRAYQTTRTTRKKAINSSVNNYFARAAR
jgi:hypothetical protein